MAKAQLPAEHPLTAPPFTTRSLNLTFYHGTAYAITTLQPSDAGLLEYAPPEAYATRTATQLPQHTGQPRPPLVYSVQLTKPSAADCTTLIDHHAVFTPAYQQARLHGQQQAWNDCLTRLEETLQLATRTGHGAAVILRPTDPDGDFVHVPEYLSLRPISNTRIPDSRIHEPLAPDIHHP